MAMTRKPYVRTLYFYVGWSTLLKSLPAHSKEGRRVDTDPLVFSPFSPQKQTDTKVQTETTRTNRHVEVSKSFYRPISYPYVSLFSYPFSVICCPPLLFCPLPLSPDIYVCPTTIKALSSITPTKQGDVDLRNPNQYSTLLSGHSVRIVETSPQSGQYLVQPGNIVVQSIKEVSLSLFLFRHSVGPVGLASPFFLSLQRYSFTQNDCLPWGNAGRAMASTFIEGGEESTCKRTVD